MKLLEVDGGHVPQCPIASDVHCCPLYIRQCISVSVETPDETHPGVN